MCFGVIGSDLLCRGGCAGRHTLDAIMEMFAWSMTSLLVGNLPGRRRDATPVQQSDSHRISLSGFPIGVRAALLQCRGKYVDVAMGCS